MASPLGRPDFPIERTLRLIGAFIIAVFAIFVLRLFQLQIVEGEALRERSERNSVRTIRLDAPRGDILDREGRVLATHRPAYELQVIPNGLSEPGTTFAVLARLLDEDPSLLEDRVGVRKGRGRFQPVSLVDDLDFDRLAKVETHRYALPGVVTDVQPRRHYVEGAMAAHLMGLIGEIGGDQLERRSRQGYRPGDIIGQAGLEAQLESHLRAASSRCSTKWRRYPAAGSWWPWISISSGRPRPRSWTFPMVSRPRWARQWPWTSEPAMCW
jgi:penicillin-binding protein 2